MVYTNPVYKMPKLPILPKIYNQTDNMIYNFNHPFSISNILNNLNEYDIFCLYIINIFIILPYLWYLWKKPLGTIFIVRGLHGIGKNMVANKILDDYDPDSYIHIDMYDNWNHNSNKKSHYVQLMKCNNNCLKDFINSMNESLECIIITNPFIKKWEYKIYKELAKKYNYDWTIYQLEAESKEHAKYFETRSAHKLPILGNNYLYDKWEHDHEAINIEPDYPELNGDSLPGYNIKRHLDIEIDEYMKNR